MNRSFAQLRRSLYRLIWGDPMYDWIWHPVMFRVRRVVLSLVPMLGFAVLGLMLLRFMAVGVLNSPAYEELDTAPTQSRVEPIVFQRRCFQCHEPLRPFRLRQRADDELNFDDANATVQLSRTNL